MGWRNITLKILIVILIEVTIALIHVFRLGQLFSGLGYNLYYSYFSDIVIPIGAYFLLTLNESTFPFLHKWFIKAGIIFAFTTFAEICQLFGIEILGVTFDPIDILMYGIGVSIAAFLDVKVFTRYFGFWVITRNV